MHQINALAIHLHPRVPVETHLRKTLVAQSLSHDLVHKLASACRDPPSGGWTTDPTKEGWARCNVPEGENDLKHISEDLYCWEKLLSVGRLTKLRKATEITNKEDQEKEKVGIKVEGESIPQWSLTPVLRLYYKACFRLDTPSALKWVTVKSRKQFSGSTGQELVTSSARWAKNVVLWNINTQRPLQVKWP